MVPVMRAWHCHDLYVASVRQSTRRWFSQAGKLITHPQTSASCRLGNSGRCTKQETQILANITRTKTREHGLISQNVDQKEPVKALSLGQCPCPLFRSRYPGCVLNPPPHSLE